MRIHRSPDELARVRLAHPVVTLGVFDGVHVGHRFVIRECMTLAAERAGESLVITFNQHPRALIAGSPPKLITPIEHRLNLFAELGVDHCLVLDFDEELRRIGAGRFAHEIFEDLVGAEVVVLGHNCRFGRDREGSAAWLIEHAAEFSFETRRAPEIRVGERILSSTEIRAAIERGDLELASTMLGRPFSLFGTVVEGDRRGRTIGFPTANLDLHHGLLPPRGVYGCRVQVDGRARFALVNVGRRPTVDPEAQTDSVEAHILDFSGDVYGRDLELVFLRRLRDERKFDSLEALREQIAADEARFRAFISAAPRPRGGGDRS